MPATAPAPSPSASATPLPQPRHAQLFHLCRRPVEHHANARSALMLAVYHFTHNSSRQDPRCQQRASSTSNHAGYDLHTEITSTPAPQARSPLAPTPNVQAEVFPLNSHVMASFLAIKSRLKHAQEVGSSGNKAGHFWS